MEETIETVEKWAAEIWKEQPVFKPDSDGGSGTLKFKYAGKCGDLDGYLETGHSGDTIVLHLYAPGALPERKLAPAMDAVAAINQGMSVGNVEIVRRKENWFRFRAGMNVEGGKLSTAMLDNLLDIAVATIEQYYPAMLSICFAGMAPKRAIAEAGGEKPGDDWISDEIAGADAGELLPLGEAAPSPVLSAWAKELADAISGEADINTWRAIGCGAVVTHDDMDRAREMLLRAAIEANMRFVHIESGDVLDIPLGAADPFANAAPILVYLEPGQWMGKIGDGASSEEADRIRGFRMLLAACVGAFDPEHPVIYATSAYSLEDVSPALRKRGFFDRYFHVPKLSPDILGKEFIALFGPENCDASITSFPGKVGKLLGNEFDSGRLRSLAALNTARLVKRESRKLNFLDLVDMAAAGLGDSDEAARDNEVLLRHTAIHEAGHAAMALLDSNGKNAPEYSTIVARKDFNGVVVESMSYSFARGGLFTYADFRHKIRVSLAGRAAEEVALGLDWISDGSSADLESCSKLASRAFAFWGFAPGMGDAETSASNLAVIVGDASPSENLHNETLVRKFLADEYRATVKTLTGNRALLDAIAGRLIRDSMLDQGEIAELYAAHLPERLSTRTAARTRRER